MCDVTRSTHNWPFHFSPSQKFSILKIDQICQTNEQLLPDPGAGKSDQYSSISRDSPYCGSIWQIKRFTIVNTTASIWLQRYTRIFVLYCTLSLPRSAQFASRNRYCPQTNIQGYFRVKWRFLLMYSRKQMGRGNKCLLEPVGICHLGPTSLRWATKNIKLRPFILRHEITQL